MSWKRRDRRPSSAAARSACALRSSRRQLAAKVLDGDADRGQRCLQVVAQRRQQRRCQFSLLTNQLGGVALAEELRSLDGDRHDAAQRIERAEIEVRCDRREKPHRLHAVAERHDRDASLGVADAHVAAIGALARVELQRPTSRRERGIQDVDVDRARRSSHPGKSSQPSSAGRAMATLESSKRRATCRASDVHRGGGVGRQQDIPCQVEESGDFVAARDGLTLASLRRRRQVAGDDGDRQKSEERNPVLRVGDSQRSNAEEGRRN